MPVPRAEPRVEDTVDAAATPVRARRRRKRRSWARRKHLGLITVALVLIVLVVGVLIVVLTWDDGRASFTRQVAAAAGTETATTIPTAATPTTPVTPSSSAPGTQAAGPTTVRGKIATVGDSRWTLTGSNGLTYTIVVTGDTTLPRKRDFGSFVVGDAISVKGALDQGTITAASVVPAKSG